MFNMQLICFRQYQVTDSICSLGVLHNCEWHVFSFCHWNTILKLFTLIKFRLLFSNEILSETEKFQTDKSQISLTFYRVKLQRTILNRHKFKLHSNVSSNERELHREVVKVPCAVFYENWFPLYHEALGGRGRDYFPIRIDRPKNVFVCWNGFNPQLVFYIETKTVLLSSSFKYQRQENSCRVFFVFPSPLGLE